MPEERAPGKPLPLQMLDLISGYWVSQLLYVVARLGLADTLKQGPMKVDDLAKQVDVDRRALYRMMRALASVGVFAEGDPGVFSLTPLAETLRSDLASPPPHPLATGQLFQKQQVGQVADSRVWNGREESIILVPSRECRRGSRRTP